MFGLGYVVAAGFGLGSLMGNPRRRRRNPASKPYVVPYRGKFYRFPSVEKASAFASDIHRRTGIIATIIDSRQTKINPHRKMRCNPGSIDEAAAHELWLYIINDGDLYRQNIKYVIANLAKKIKKGTYDSKKALKLWGYSADWGAKKYTKEFDTPGDPKPNGSFGIFNKPTRMAVAAVLQREYQEELDQAAEPVRRDDKGTQTNPRGTRDLETRNYTIGANYVDITTWRNAAATAFIAVTVRGPGGVKGWEAKSQGPSAGGYHKPTQAAEKVYKEITGSWPSFGGGESMYKAIAEAAATKNNPRRRKRC